MTEFLIPAKDLDGDGRDFSFAVADAWADSALADTGLRSAPSEAHGSFEGHVQKNGDEILVSGRLKAKLIGRCVRCLEDAYIIVDTQVGALLTPDVPSLPSGEDGELSPEDLDRVTYVGDELVLDDLVRENLVLECPMQPMCQDDCKGLQVPAHIRPPEDFGGAEAGVDPRLSPLLKLRDQLNRDESLPKENRETSLPKKE